MGKLNYVLDFEFYVMESLCESDLGMGEVE